MLKGLNQDSCWNVPKEPQASHRSAELHWGCCEVRESNWSSANGAQRKGAILPKTKNQWNLSQYVLKHDKRCQTTSSKHLQTISTSKLNPTSPKYPKSPRFSSCELCIPWSPKPMFIVPGSGGWSHGTGIDSTMAVWCWDCQDLYWLLRNFYVWLFSDVCIIDRLFYDFWLYEFIWLCDSMVVNNMAVLGWAFTGKRKEISGIICRFFKCSILCQCAWHTKHVLMMGSDS